MHSSDQSQGHSRLCRSDLTHSARSACRPATRSLLPARELSTEQRSSGQPKGRSRTGQLSERRRLRPTAHGAGQGTLRDRNNHQPAVTGLTMQRRRGESEVQMSLNSRLSGSTAAGSKRRIVAGTLGIWSGSYSDVHAQAVSSANTTQTTNETNVAGVRDVAGKNPARDFHAANRVDTFERGDVSLTSRAILSGDEPGQMSCQTKRQRQPLPLQPTKHVLSRRLSQCYSSRLHLRSDI